MHLDLHVGVPLLLGNIKTEPTRSFLSSQVHFQAVAAPEAQINLQVSFRLALLRIFQVTPRNIGYIDIILLFDIIMELLRDHQNPDLFVRLN